jgi:hypothetical protein
MFTFPLLMHGCLSNITSTILDGLDHYQQWLTECLQFDLIWLSLSSNHVIVIVMKANMADRSVPHE